MSAAEFIVTDEERAYMLAPLTPDEKTATKGMPRMVAHGWVTRHRAQHLAKKRGDERIERITDALVNLAEAMNP
jgi:hypothetical protein